MVRKKKARSANPLATCCALSGVLHVVALGAVLLLGQPFPRPRLGRTLDVEVLAGAAPGARGGGSGRPGKPAALLAPPRPPVSAPALLPLAPASPTTARPRPAAPPPERGTTWVGRERIAPSQAKPSAPPSVAEVAARLAPSSVLPASAAPPAGPGGEGTGAGAGSAGTGDGPDVLAVYAGGKITRDQFSEYMRDEFGFDLSRVDGSEAAKIHLAARLLQQMVVDEMMVRDAEQRGIGQREGIQRALQHLAEDENIEELAARLGAKIAKPTAAEIADYYEQHREHFKEISLPSISKSIGQILRRARAREAFEEYIKRLKQDAAITRAFDLLDQADASPDAAVFSANGKAYTVRQFQEELKGLGAEERERLEERKARDAYLEALVTRHLLLDASGTVANGDVRRRMERIRRALLLDTLRREEIDSKVRVEEAEVEGYYQRSKQRWTVAAQARFAVVVVPAGKTEGERKAALELMADVRRAISGGATFETAAAQVRARAPQVRAADDTGWVGEGDHLEDLLAGLCPFHERAFRTLPPGQVGEPFEYAGSVYVMKVLERREQRTPRRDEIEGFLRGDLWSAKQGMAEERYLGDILDRARMEIRQEALTDMAR